MNEILAAALHHHEAGRSVIAVNRDKRPYHEGWNRYFTTPQTDEEIKAEFSNGSDGIALILYPSCRYAVLDFDGPHAEAAWNSTGIDLTDTARIRTRSGGKHLYFLMPTDAPSFRRKVRIVRAICTCTDNTGHAKPCGVDLLINGYALIPPSPGYSEDPDYPLEAAVELPAAVLARAVENSREPVNRTGDIETGKVSHGERKSVLVSLAGSMRARGMSIEAIRAALEADNEVRFDPPLDVREIEDVLKSAAKWGAAKSLENLTDLGNAQRFEAMHSGTVLFSPVRKKWILWNGRYWQWDENAEILDYARAVIKSMYAEAGVLDDEKVRKAYGQHAIKSEARGRIEAQLYLASAMPMIRTSLDRFDQSSYLLNAKNCTVNLKTGKASPFYRENFITKSVPIDYSPEARCPLFEEFMNTIMCGRRELVDFIQRAIGYSITGDTGEQCMFILHGNSSNGKSTMVNVLRGILGSDYSKEIKPEVFLESKGDNSADYHISELPGKRFVAMSETSKRKQLKVSLVKQITGGEPIIARRPYELPFEFTPTFKLWLSTNHKPTIPDDNDAIWRRLHLIPFDMTFTDEMRIKRYEDRLLTEAPGILNWFVDGAVQYYAQGLNPPQTIKQQNLEYRAQEDVIGNFLAEHCETGPLFTTLFSPLYDQYRKYCEDSGERYDSKKAFGFYLTNHGFDADNGPRNVSIRLKLRLVDSQNHSG